MNDWFQLAIVGFIVLSILYHVWKGGAGTGKLQHDVSNVRAQVTSLGGRVEKLVPLPSRVGELEEEMKELKAEAATGKDIARVEERISTVRAEIEGHRALSQATNEGVRRIERMLIEKGLNGK
jgi:cell division protein FtsB